MQTDTTTEQLKSEFRYTLSRLSHEIRNPVALISSELQLLASSHPEVASYEGWADIMDNLEYVSELLTDLSGYNNAGKISPVPTNLGEYLRGILNSVKPTLDYLGVSLEIRLDEPLPELSLDRTKMRQALLNLLRNAQESLSLPDGKITVHAFSQGNGACISIRDNGCGIPPERLADIFTPFITSKPNGNGLGLAVTKQIVEAHGGHIEVSSTIGEGTEFQIFLG